MPTASPPADNVPKALLNPLLSVAPNIFIHQLGYVYQLGLLTH